MTRFEPRGNRVLIRPQETSDVTEGGIIIPDMAKDRPQIGEIMAVGDGEWVMGDFHAMDLGVGDIVLYGKYVGTDITIGDEEMSIMNADDIFGRIVEDFSEEEPGESPDLASP